MEELSHVGMTKCHHCGEVVDVILDTHLRKKLPHYTEGFKNKDGSVSMVLCDKCQKIRDEGIPFRCAKCGSEGSIIPGTESYKWAKELVDTIRAGDDPKFKDQPVIGIEVTTCPICMKEA